jgi:hypothetical protein
VRLDFQAPKGPPNGTGLVFDATGLFLSIGGPPINYGSAGKAELCDNLLIWLVPQTGLEPVTPSLRMTCSTN